MIFLSLLAAGAIVGLAAALVAGRDFETTALAAAFLAGGLAVGLAEREVPAHDLLVLVVGIAAAVLACLVGGALRPRLRRPRPGGAPQHRGLRHNANKYPRN